MFPKFSASRCFSPSRLLQASWLINALKSAVWGMRLHYITGIFLVCMDCGRRRRNKRDGGTDGGVSWNGRQWGGSIDSRGDRIRGHIPLAAHPHIFRMSHAIIPNWHTNRTMQLFCPLTSCLSCRRQHLTCLTPPLFATSQKPMVLMFATRTSRCCKPITSSADPRASPFKSVL